MDSLKTLKWNPRQHVSIQSGYSFPNHRVATKCQCHCLVCPYPFLGGRGFRVSGLPGFLSAHVAVSAAPAGQQCGQLPHVGRTLGDLGPCGSWSPPRALPEVRTEGGTRGPDFPRAAAAGEGFAERTSGASSPLPPPSRAASGRALRGGGSRCEGCVRPPWGPARSSRRGLRCLRTRLWPGGWARRGALGRSVTARVLSVRSAAPPGGPGAEPGFDDALHWALAGTLLWQLVFSSFWGNAQNTFTEAAGLGDTVLSTSFIFVGSHGDDVSMAATGKQFRFCFRAFFFFFTFLSSELRKFFVFSSFAFLAMENGNCM